MVARTTNQWPTQVDNAPVTDLEKRALDPQGLIRACGRVAACESLQYNEWHPVILPYNCLLSRLLANFTHRITLHGGSQLMVRELRT